MKITDRCWRQLNEPYEINYLFAIPGALPITSMSGITKNKWNESKRYGCLEPRKLIQLVSYDTYKKYGAHVTNGSRSRIDWNVTVHKASGDLSTLTIPSPTEHATIPLPQELPYKQLYQAYHESRDLISQMKKFTLSRIIKEKDDRIKEMELQMAQSLQLNLNPMICSPPRNFTPSQLEAAQSQHPVHIQPLSIQEPPVVKPVDQNDPNAVPGGDLQNGDLKRVESIVGHTTKLQDDLQKLGLKIKVHEENLRILKSQTNNLDESILDMQVSLGKYHSSSVATTENDNPIHSEENTIAQIMQQEKSAAGVLCQLKTRHGTLASDLALTKDVLGIVATLGKVDDDNLSRLFSEYLGLETMMAIVCKTFEGAKSLETYDKEGNISTSTGLHGLGPSIGRPIDGRFLVICLEGLRPYAGDFVAEDPQRRLALLKPRLPSGECPPGFLGFAVNMINLDRLNLYYLTSTGNGLRETLFYSLFSRLQVYRTRAEMQLALPCISDGAVSLDGGMIRSAGVFSLGTRKDVEVRFMISSGTPTPPVDYENVKEKIKIMKWDKERLLEDMQREHTLLNHVKHSFESKKQEFVKFLAESSSYVSQQQVQAGVRR